jgi:hypothetical protein
VQITLNRGRLQSRAARGSVLGEPIIVRQVFIQQEPSRLSTAPASRPACPAFRPSGTPGCSWRQGGALTAAKSTPADAGEFLQQATSILKQVGRTAEADALQREAAAAAH